ncbi:MULTISPECIES: phosphotransferase [unclassified Rhodococcus (in: high G+C Gram-positive bacteria)]|uniref:phosphotransferase n=1 Tax=unclassified Rhodococcus (in: high G+C Gram-positive bacteria) TaxID=192944 RepID=UPI00339A4ABB
MRIRRKKTVVYHGDACAPNTLIDEAGPPCAHVDLGSMGVGDRWADLAPAIMSTQGNYGGLLTAEVLDGYGIELDQDRLDFYCRLWNATQNAG